MIGKDFVFTGEGRVQEVEVLHYSKAGGQLEQGNAGLEFCTEVFHGFGLCSVSIPYDGTLCFSAAVSCRQEPVFLQGSSSSVQEQLVSCWVGMKCCIRAVPLPLSSPSSACPTAGSARQGSGAGSWMLGGAEQQKEGAQL